MESQPSYDYIPALYLTSTPTRTIPQKDDAFYIVFKNGQQVLINDEPIQPSKATLLFHGHTYDEWHHHHERLHSWMKHPQRTILDLQAMVILYEVPGLLFGNINQHDELPVEFQQWLDDLNHACAIWWCLQENATWEDALMDDDHRKDIYIFGMMDHLKTKNIT